MAAKKTYELYLFFAITLIFGMVYYIVKRESNSSFADLANWIGSKTEGFAIRVSPTVRCPKNMKYFANSGGASFCCGGVVNPYGATCSDPTKLCALAPNTPDPRGKPFGSVKLCV